MTSELLFRTEDIRPEKVLSYLVETSIERETIDALKGRSPVVLRGSRGVGKSFLLRVAEAELERDFKVQRILPVYVTFARASLIRTPSDARFFAWMMSKICNRIIRATSSFGLTLPGGSAIEAIQGGAPNAAGSKMEQVEQIYEDSWKSSVSTTLPTEPPDPEIFRDAIEDLCRSTGIDRVNLLVDEAAHAFIPEQQRQFFTLMRDLRSPYMSIKAAVYPGVTAYGESFQPSHDATMLSVDRSVTGSEYRTAMRNIVYKQDDSSCSA
jgi:hypothetical protein